MPQLSARGLGPLSPTSTGTLPHCVGTLPACNNQLLALYEEYRDVLLAELLDEHQNLVRPASKAIYQLNRNISQTGRLRHIRKLGTTPSRQYRD